MSPAGETLAPQYAFGKEANRCVLIGLLELSSKALGQVQSCVSLAIHLDNASSLNTQNLLAGLPRIVLTALPGWKMFNAYFHDMFCFFL